MLKLNDFATIEAARTHPEVVGRMVSPDMVISMLTEHDSALTLEDLAKTNPKAAGFWLALNGGAVTEYNVITGSYVGMKHQALLAYLVSQRAVTQEFMNALIVYANPTVYPHARKTELDFQLAHDTIKRVALDQNKYEHGRVFMKTNADCEAHTPQIYKLVKYLDNTEEYIRVAGFRTVEKAGPYRIECANLQNLYVDNAYGVITA